MAANDELFARSDDAYAVLLHQSANTAMTDNEAHLFKLFGHTWSPITAECQAMLFSDVRQQNHILALPSAHRTRAPSPVTSLLNSR